MIHYIYQFSKLIRAHNIALSILSSLIVANLISFNDIKLIVISAMIISLVMASGNIINDYYDIKIDMLEHPSRPLPNNIFSQKFIFFIMFVLIVLIFILSLFVNEMARKTLYIGIIPPLYLYSIFLKKIPLINNLIIAYLLGMVFMFNEIVFVNSFSLLMLPALLAFGLSFIRELIKDIDDYHGDKKFNIYTIPVIIGISNARYIAIILIIIFQCLCILPYYLNILSYKYFISLIFLIEILALDLEKGYFFSKMQEIKFLPKIVFVYFFSKHQLWEDLLAPFITAHTFLNYQAYKDFLP